MKALTKLMRSKFADMRGIKHMPTRNRNRNRRVIKKDTPVGSVEVTCSALNVRAGAGTTFSRIGGLIKGQKISYYEEKNGWLRIQYGAQIGWVCAKYTTFKDSTVTPGPGPEEKPEQPEEKPEKPEEKPEQPEEKPEQPEEKPEQPPQELTPLQQLLKEHPEVTTNQHLITLLYKLSDNTFQGAYDLGKKYGVDLNELVNDRNGLLDRSGLDGGETTKPEPGGEKPKPPESGFNEFQVSITADYLNVRSGPSTDYGKIGGLNSGEIVTVIGESGGWYKINYNGKEGWISGKYTQKHNGETVSGSAEMASYLRRKFPNGVTSMFCLIPQNGNDQEFRNQANQLLNMYPMVCVKGGQLSNSGYGDITRRGRGSALSAQVITLMNSIKKCLADNPDSNSGVDDAKVAKIDNLVCMCHGWSDGDGGTDAMKAADIPSFASAIKPYMSDSFRMQFYSCSCAKNSKTDAYWYERYTPGTSVIQEDSKSYFNQHNMGKDSFCAKLAEALGPTASVFGHSTAGHTTNNYCAHVFGKDAGNAANGKHMFDYYFPQSFVAEQAAARGQSQDSVRTSMYKYYTGWMGNHGKEAFIDPEGSGKKLRSGWQNQ